jgi:hypothetical protein
MMAIYTLIVYYGRRIEANVMNEGKEDMLPYPLDQCHPWISFTCMIRLDDGWCPHLHIDIQCRVDVE